MNTATQDHVLARLRRYRHWLIMGGGGVITVLVLAACQWQIGASVSAYVAGIKEGVSIDVRRSITFIDWVSATLGSSAQAIELAWGVVGPEDAERLQALGRDGILKVPSEQDAPTLLVLDRQKGGDLSAARPYLHLAERMADPVSAMVTRNAGELTAYLYSPDSRILLLSSAPRQNAEWYDHITANREWLFLALAVPGDADLLSSKTASRDPATGLPLFRWLPERTSPLTGKRVIPVATTVIGRDGRPFGTLVFELPVATLAATLPLNSFKGKCLILGPEGSLILSCHEGLNPEDFARAKEALASGLGALMPSTFQHGEMLAGWPLSVTQWTLVHSLSWQDIAAGVHGQVVAAILSAVAIIFITWALLLLLKWKVFGLTFEQTRRVLESEQLSRALIDMAPVGLGLISIDSGKPLLRSSSMIDMEGRGAALKRSLSAELAGYYLHRPVLHHPPGVSNVLHVDLGFATEDGQCIDLAASMVRARYQGLDVLVVAFIDVTSRKRTEQELLNARQAAGLANAAKSAFLAAMSHDIRTPLNAIMGNLELLSHSALDAAQKDRLDTVRAASDSLLSIVSDVLDFSKIEAGEFSLETLEFDVLEVASRALRMFAPMARAKGLVLTCDLGIAAAQPMRGDPVRVAQIINNLLSNAIKFTASGRVTLRLALEQAGSELMIVVTDTGIGMSQEQLSRLFKVFTREDTAIGRRFGGTGLGLALCLRLAEAMNGALAVQSEPGQGSSVTLRLPVGHSAGGDIPQFNGERVLLLAAFEEERTYVAQALAAWGLCPLAYGHPAQIALDEAEDADALILWGYRETWHTDDENRLVEDSAWVIECGIDGPSQPLVSGRFLSASVYGLKGLAMALQHAFKGLDLTTPAQCRRALARPLNVLVAEDNPVSRKLFEEQLVLLGCDVKAVADGEQALASLDADDYDALLTDLSMPGMDGYELARQVRLRNRMMPVIVVTAHATSRERERCAQIGVHRVLSKPLSLDELSHVLSEVCGVERLRCEADPIQGLLGGGSLPDAIRQTFLESGQVSLVLLKQAFQAGDAQGMLAELHSLRGAFGVFHMHAMAHKGHALEQAIRGAGMAANAELIEDFCGALEVIVSSGGSSLEDLLDRIIELAQTRKNADGMSEIAALAGLMQASLR